MSRLNGKVSRLTLKLEMDICMAINREHKRAKTIHAITANDWAHIPLPDGPYSSSAAPTRTQMYPLQLRREGKVSGIQNAPH